MPIPTPLKSVTIDGETLDFAKGFQLHHTNGAEPFERPIDQWSGWLDLQLHRSHAERVQMWSGERTGELTFSTSTDEHRYTDFKVSAPMPIGSDFIKILIIYGKKV